MKQLINDLDSFIELCDDPFFNGGGDDILDIVDSYRRISYDNFNSIQFDGDKRLGLIRRKMIYAEDRSAWTEGRIEFLEKIIKDNLGEDFWNEHCKELD